MKRCDCRRFDGRRWGVALTWHAVRSPQRQADMRALCADPPQHCTFLHTTESTNFISTSDSHTAALFPANFNRLIDAFMRGPGVKKLVFSHL